MEASSVMRTVLAAGIVGQALCYISPNGMLLAPARTCLVPVGARMPRGCTTTAGPRRVAALQASQAAASPPAAEARLLELVQSTKGRGQSATKTQLQEIQDAIAELERSGGEADPICSPLIAGSWELLYTSKSAFDIRNPLGKRVDGSKPGIEGFFGAIFGEDSQAARKLADASSSSPIQRTVTSIDGLQVSQDITLTGADPRVDQRVVFNDNAYLRLSASASTTSNSSTRIDFTFDLAYFQLGPARIPYPVPFKLLGDEAKGWLDTTYLSPRLRISRGNKGTTFILRRLPYS